MNDKPSKTTGRARRSTAGAECYERYVAALGDGPPYDELSPREQAAWDAVADAINNESAPA